MIGDYSIMDWVTLGGIATVAATVLGTFVKLSRDNSGLLSEFKMLSKEHDALSKEIEGLSKEFATLSKGHLKEYSGLSKEHSGLSKEHQSIKKDTEYISDEMKFEKMARAKLYENSSHAKEILETMDLMREVVLQNAQLNKEVADLKVENKELMQLQAQDLAKLKSTISKFSSQLSAFEDYRESEEIQRVLKRIQGELSEYDN